MKSMIHISQVRAKRQGVALIFFLLVLGIMLGFLMMIVNTGMIVYQKMRLQSATDLAAYAAASVQASYLGNDANAERKVYGSGEESIKYLNNKIFKRYGDLLNDLQFGSISPAPGFPGMLMSDAVSCAALCQAANLANGKYASKLYHDAVNDIEGYRAQILQILTKLPQASRKAAEATLALNIPEMQIDEGALGAMGSTINKAEDVIKQNKDKNKRDNFKNAILSFATEKGMYLSSVVAPVPHAFIYYGPACFNANRGVSSVPAYYCTVNGSGSPGGPKAYQSAYQAFLRGMAVKKSSGNVGSIDPISQKTSRGIRLMFIPNYHKPDPFAVVAAEWYPKNGSFVNLENSLGAKGSLFPKQTRLVAVAAAQPFGGNLIASDSQPYGTRLQSIRRLLLDPRMTDVRKDFPGLFDYLKTFGVAGLNTEGEETVEGVIQRFLH